MPDEAIVSLIDSSYLTSVVFYYSHGNTVRLVGVLFLLFKQHDLSESNSYRQQVLQLL